MTIAKPLAQDLFDPEESFVLGPLGDTSNTMAGKTNGDLDQADKTQVYSNSLIPGGMSDSNEKKKL